MQTWLGQHRIPFKHKPAGKAAAVFASSFGCTLEGSL
jgi:hypothetical protein